MAAANGQGKVRQSLASTALFGASVSSLAGLSDSEGGESWEEKEEEGLNYTQEQEELKSSFKAAAELEGEGEGEGLLVPRHKTAQDQVCIE